MTMNSHDRRNFFCMDVLVGKLAGNFYFPALSEFSIFNRSFLNYRPVPISGCSFLAPYRTMPVSFFPHVGLD